MTDSRLYTDIEFIFLRGLKCQTILFIMTSYNAIVSATKLLSAATFVILGAGIFLIPSDDEKIRKMKASSLLAFPNGTFL